MKLRRLSDDEFDTLAEQAKAGGIPLSSCPTCGAKEVQIQPDVYGWENGTYKFRGEEHECDCPTQMTLRKHYLLANIGDQYQRLNWDDYDGSPAVIDSVRHFIDHFDAYRRNGMGLEFYGGLGGGKTFAATHIAKELIKQGENVYFLPFTDLISLYQLTDGREQEQRLKNIALLILDEVVSPQSQAQSALFSVKFEELVRHRTNFNLPTIMTTNLTPDKLHEKYPRTYSLLEAKQIRVRTTGEDARMGKIANENLSIIAHEEVRPIT